MDGGLEVHAALGLDADLEAAHVEEHVRVVLAVDRHEALLPLDRRHGPGQSILDVPVSQRQP